MQIVDDKTGELVEAGRLAWIPDKKINAFKEGWTAMSNVAMKHIFSLRASGDIQSKDFEVLMYLSTVLLDFENLIQVSLADVGRSLNMHRQNVKRSVDKLVDYNILIEGPKVGRSKTYRLNPHIGWKGSSKNHHKAVKNAIGLSVIKGGKYPENNNDDS